VQVNSYTYMDVTYVSATRTTPITPRSILIGRAEISASPNRSCRVKTILSLSLSPSPAASQSPSPPPPSLIYSGRLRRVLALQNTYPAPPPPLPITWRPTHHPLHHHDELWPPKIPAGRRRFGLPQRGSSTTPCVGTLPSARPLGLGLAGFQGAASAEMNAVIDWEQHMRRIWGCGSPVRFLRHFLLYTRSACISFTTSHLVIDDHSCRHQS
jgi:hypothetical protein